jgi:hypothetical protein
VPDSGEIAEYCREIETYLCQQNQGHLIRIVGPSFELVSRWASDGVPLKVAFRGIDRTVERHARKAARRRPLKIDFCEADVLDVFDEWRRATGVTAANAGGAPSSVPSPRKGPSLPEHLERALLRLTNARATDVLDSRADPLIDRLSSELDRVRANARGLRGAERHEVIDRLARLDDELSILALETIDHERLQQIEREADRDLAPYQSTMPAADLARARHAAVDQAVRSHLRLPVLTFHLT